MADAKHDPALATFAAAETAYPGITRQRWIDRRQYYNRIADAKGESRPYSPVKDAADAQAIALVAMAAQADRNVGLVAIKERPTDDARESLYAALEGAEALREGLSPAQKTTTFVATEPGLPVAFAFPGDIHAGASGVRYDLIKRDMELIRDTPGMVAVCMGDVMENAKHLSKAGEALYHAAFPSPEEQYHFARLRLGIATGKWVALLGGNHEGRDGNVGIDRLPELARDLGCPYFDEAGGSIVAHVGDERYCLFVKHDWGGKGALNSTNSQRRMFDDFPQWEIADVIVLGHLHYNDVHQPPRKGGYTTYLRAGTYKVHDGYAEKNGFASEYGVPIVIFLPDRHEVIAFRGNLFPIAIEMFKHLREQYRQGKVCNPT